MSEYLYAVNALAYFYADAGGNTSAAEAAYARAFEAYDYITGNIYNEKTVKFYADTLKDYKQLLLKVNKEGDANRVAEREKNVRDRLKQFDRIREQQNLQQVQQGAPTASRPQ